MEVQRTNAFHFSERVVKDPRKTYQGTQSHNITERISHFENHDPYGKVKGGERFPKELRKESS